MRQGPNREPPWVNQYNRLLATGSEMQATFKQKARIDFDSMNTGRSDSSAAAGASLSSNALLSLQPGKKPVYV